MTMGMIGFRSATRAADAGLRQPIVDETERVHDGGEPEPGEKGELEQVLDVAEVDVPRRQQHAEPSGEHEERHEGKQHQRQHLPVGRPLEQDERRQQDGRLEEEVHQGGADGGDGQDLPGEPDLLHERRVVHDRGARPADGAREQRPRQEAGQEENGEVVDPVRQQLLEHDGEDHEVERRVEQRPDEPEDAVLVLDLQLLADEVPKQLPVLPDQHEPLDRGRSLRPVDDLSVGRGNVGGRHPAPLRLLLRM